MGKDPAFLFYPNDYIGGTMGMTFEEKGAYVELLMLQFNRGHMTKDMIGQTVGQLWDKLEDKFSVDAEGKYFNQRLDEEQKKRKAYSQSRRNNLSGKNQYTKSDGHTTTHKEDVDINEDSIVITNIKMPTEIEFIEYGEKLCQEAKLNFNGLHFSLRAKYDSWKDDGWKDGHGNPIKNWKNKLRSTLPYLKPINASGNNTRKEKFQQVADELREDQAL